MKAVFYRNKPCHDTMKLTDGTGHNVSLSSVLIMLLCLIRFHLCEPLLPLPPILPLLLSVQSSLFCTVVNTDVTLLILFLVIP